MCIIGLGHASLVQVWEACRENADPEAWKALREIVGGELEHINLVVRFYQSLDFDRRFMDFDCDFWPRLVCSFLRQWDFAPPIPLGEYHIPGHFPTACF